MQTMRKQKVPFADGSIDKLLHCADVCRLQQEAEKILAHHLGCYYFGQVDESTSRIAAAEAAERSCLEYTVVSAA